MWPSITTGLYAQEHTSIPISSIFSVDMIAKGKDYTIAKVWLKPCFTIDDDIRFGSANEEPEFIFLSTHTLEFIVTILRLLA